MIINTKKSMRINPIIWAIVVTTVIFLMWSKTNSYHDTNVVPETTVVQTSNSRELNLDTDLKYILIWTDANRDPIFNLKLGRNAFIKRNCSVTNCFVSQHRDFFENVTQFDVIVFHGPDLLPTDLPKYRSHHQKYVFASMESSHYYPTCDPVFNNFFNWTWTYKLNSDEQYSYISIWNKDGAVIGPKETMRWKRVEEMDNIDEVLKKKLSTKKYAAAWFVSNCITPSERETKAQSLKTELEKYKLQLDIYGNCGPKKCPRFKSSECLQLLERDYYFYLSFENSFSEDYVTEKLLNALKHYTVPIVFGGANYTRFMPDGIYLDARKMTMNQLAEKMAELIDDEEKYYNYFKWHNHYSYHDVEDSPETDSYCQLCAMINNKKRFEETSQYNNFSLWWNMGKRCLGRREPTKSYEKIKL